MRRSNQSELAEHDLEAEGADLVPIDEEDEISPSFADAFSALKEVRRASKMRADAEADVRSIESGLEQDRDELAHREDVEANYEQIVADQTAEIEEASAAIARAESGLSHQRSEVSKLKRELEHMRQRHEQELRPYRNLMDSSRGRSDDSAKSLANIRRAVRNAERTLNEATRNRDTRISAAHRAVDNAQERVGALDAELNSLRMADDVDGTSAAAIAKTENELASNQRALEFARSEVIQVTQESQDAVDQAQRKLLSLQRELAQAEKVTEANKSDAAAHKDEYDTLYRNAQAEEKTQEDAIKACEARIRELTERRDTARGHLQDAQDVLDEANEIHTHPETTEGLRERIAYEEADLEDALAELDELVQTERELRQSTRSSRLTVIGIVVVSLAIVLLCVWFFFLR